MEQFEEATGLDSRAHSNSLLSPPGLPECVRSRLEAPFQTLRITPLQATRYEPRRKPGSD